MFTSLNWVPRAERVTPPAMTGLGEIPGRARPWRDGSPLVAGDGVHFCGCPEWFEDGAPLRATPRLTTAEGWPLGCFPCGDCAPGCTPDGWECDLAGFTAIPGFDYSPWNGHWRLERSDNVQLERCAWRAQEDFGGLLLVIGFNPPLAAQLTLTDATGAQTSPPFYRTMIVPEFCRHALTFSDPTGGPGSGYPVDVDLTPDPCLCPP